jgi:fructose-1,6-bisphosphatase
MNPSAPMTGAQFILDQQQLRSPHASGDFSWLLCGITLAAKIVSAQVVRAGLGDILGAAGDTNVHGETQQRLDVFANKALLNGVHGFTLDRSIGAFVLSHPNIQMPPRGNIYSVNEAHAAGFPEYCRSYLRWLQSGDAGVVYSSRYIGSLVADFHRTMLKGGVFLYPPTQHYPAGKLRLLYEANPIAFLAQQAGGLASDGRRNILEMAPENLHQRTALFVGSRHEMQHLHRFAEAAAS